MAGRVSQETVEALIAGTPNARVSQIVVEVLAEVYANSVVATDSFSLSDTIETSVATIVLNLPEEVSDSLSLSDALEVALTPLLQTITIADSFSNWDDKSKVQRRNAPNVPLEVSDAFGDAFSIVGEFGLQIDTIRDNEIGWENSEALVLQDEAYVSEVNSFEFADAISLDDAVETLETIVIEVYDSMQDVWYSEDEEDLVEVSLAVPLELLVEDALEFNDAFEFVRADEREVTDRFALADSLRVSGEHGLSITGDLLALSDALEVGWNPSVEVADALSLDDSGGVEIMMPSWITLEILGDALALFDGDFSTQGTEVFMGGTQLSYLRRYLNDIPR